MDQQCINPRPSNGASLVSTVIVNALLIVAGIAVLNMVLNILGPHPGPSKIAKTKTEISYLELSLGAYKTDYGFYPDDSSPEATVNALTGYKNSPTNMEDFSSDTNWYGPYLCTTASQHDQRMKNKALLDPWKQPYHFRLRHPVHNIGSVDIWSSGPNGKDEQGEGDDIGNWR